MNMVIGVFGILIASVFWRVFCEQIILFFSIHDALVKGTESVVPQKSRSHGRDHDRDQDDDQRDDHRPVTRRAEPADENRVRRIESAASLPTVSEKVDAECPSCGKSAKVGPEFIGRRVKCKCGETFLVEA